MTLKQHRIYFRGLWMAHCLCEELIAIHEDKLRPPWPDKIKADRLHQALLALRRAETAWKV